MTLALSIVGPESLWTVSDRRLTDRGRIVRDDARKVMILETTDGVAILAYAGLGATVLGTEPADWMSAMLRGRNWSLEQSISALADALKRELPKHLAQIATLSGPSHNVVISAFINREPRLYTIDLALSKDKSQLAFRHTRWVVKAAGAPDRTPRLALAGSGASILTPEKSWRRHVLKVVRAYDERRVTSRAVADTLAAINLRVSKSLPNNTVGPDCVVAWRCREGGVHKEGGGNAFYKGNTHGPDAALLPIISCGKDIRAIVAAIRPHVLKQFASSQAGENVAELNIADVRAEMAKLEHLPNEKLK